MFKFNWPFHGHAYAKLKGSSYKRLQLTIHSQYQPFVRNSSASLVMKDDLF